MGKKERNSFVCLGGQKTQHNTRQTVFTFFTLSKAQLHINFTLCSCRHTWYISPVVYLSNFVLFFKYDVSTFDSLLAESLLPSGLIFYCFVLYLVCRDPT